MQPVVARSRRRSPSRCGLDPDPAALWPEAVDAGRAGGTARGSARRTPWRQHCRAAIDAAGPACVAVKPQLACFERLGAPGWAALERTVGVAHDARPARDRRRQARRRPGHRRRLRPGARRRDTRRRSATVPGLGADAFTANPLLGRDALEPLIDAARDAGRGLLRARPHLEPGRRRDPGRAGDPPLHERLAAIVARAGPRRARANPASPIVGAVTGATRPGAARPPARADAARRSSCCPAWARRAAASRTSAPAFAPHPAAGLVTASRSIVDAHPERGGDPAAAAAEAAEELRAAAWKA